MAFAVVFEHFYIQHFNFQIAPWPMQLVFILSPLTGCDLHVSAAYIFPLHVCLPMQTCCHMHFPFVNELCNCYIFQFLKNVLFHCLTLQIFPPTNIFKAISPFFRFPSFIYILMVEGPCPFGGFSPYWLYLCRGLCLGRLICQYSAGFLVWDEQSRFVAEFWRYPWTCWRSKVPPAL